MGKYYFTVSYKSQTFTSYLDETGDVWVLDSGGVPRYANQLGLKAKDIVEAKGLAGELVKKLVAEGGKGAPKG